MKIRKVFFPLSMILLAVFASTEPSIIQLILVTSSFIFLILSESGR